MLKHILRFFHVHRPWDIVWAHAVNSKAALATALASPDVMMLEGDVYQNAHGEVMMVHPPITESDLTFEKWFDHVVTTPKRGKIGFYIPRGGRNLFTVYANVYRFRYSQPE